MEFRLGCRKEELGKRQTRRQGDKWWYKKDCGRSGPEGSAREVGEWEKLVESKVQKDNRGVTPLHEGSRRRQLTGEPFF